MTARRRNSAREDKLFAELEEERARADRLEEKLDTAVGRLARVQALADPEDLDIDDDEDDEEDEYDEDEDDDEDDE